MKITLMVYIDKLLSDGQIDYYESMGERFFILSKNLQLSTYKDYIINVCHCVIAFVWVLRAGQHGLRW